MAASTTRSRAASSCPSGADAVDAVPLGVARPADRAPLVPPLLAARPAPAGGTVLERAAALAGRGDAEAGALLYRHAPDRWALAMVLEPEVGPAAAAAMLPLAQLALAEALGEIAPSGTDVALRWTGEVLVNRGVCGRADGIMAAGNEPAWLAVGPLLRLALAGEPGHDPGRTALVEEIGPVDPVALTEATARCWLRWLHRWEADGFAPLARAWLEMAADRGERIEAPGASGTFVGLDDEGGALIAGESETVALPLLSLWRRA